MLKLGVCRLDQFQQEETPRPIAAPSRGGYPFLRSASPRISYKLLRTGVPPSDREVMLFEYVMARMSLNSGVFRTTFAGRFAGLDEFLNGLLVRRFPQSGALTFHDWAASDCVTSYEWAASLLPLFPEAQFTASDLTLFLVEVEVDGAEAFVFEPNGGLLQYVRAPFVVRVQPPEPRVLLVNALIRRYAMRKFERMQSSWNLPKGWMDSRVGEYRQGSFLFRKIPLVHPSALAFQQTSGRFDIRRHSAFEPLEQAVHVIRTMNIFNLNYFSREQLTAGVSAVFESLMEGGVWIVGRTHEAERLEHDVSVFIKDGEGFTLLDRYGRGSEIEEIAQLSFRPQMV